MGLAAGEGGVPSAARVIGWPVNEDPK
jgi:hypothetical protein